MTIVPTTNGNNVGTPPMSSAMNNPLSGYGGLNGFDMLKNQLLTLFMFREAKNPDTNGGGSNDNTFYNIMWIFVIITVIDKLFKVLPELFTNISNILIYYFNKNKDKFSVNLPLTATKPEKQSSILIERIYDNSENDLADSILDFVTNYDGVKSIEFRRMYYVTHRNEIKIADYKGSEIYFRVEKVEVSADGGGSIIGVGGAGRPGVQNQCSSVESILFEVYSYNLSLTNLHKYLAEMTESYKIKKMNKLGDKIFYFDEVMQPLAITVEGKIQYNNAPKTLKFNMTPFYTNKSLNNMFGPDINLVIGRLRQVSQGVVKQV